MESRFDVVVVGAGPAGLFAARELTIHCPSLSVAIIDVGRALPKRLCPLITKGVCPTCALCHVAHGVGGAGMFSDGKLSQFPAGSGLAPLLGSTEEAERLSSYVFEIFQRGIKEAPSITATQCCAGSAALCRSLATHDVELKQYDVTHVGSEGIQEFCANLEQELSASGVTFLHEHRVTGVERSAQGYQIHGVYRKQPFSIDCKSCLFGTGKAARKLFRDVLCSVGASFSYNPIELGVRVETTRTAIAPLVDTHLDAKLKFQTGSEEVRTFCMCSGGFLTKCFYDGYATNDKICTISGYSLRDKKSSNSNFGVLVRKQYPAGVDPIAAQLPYIEAINRLNGNIAVQRLGDFMAGRATTSLIGNRIRSSLDECTPSNLHELLPEFVTSGIATFLQRLGALAPDLVSEDTLLHAPVWELCWDRVEVTSGFETSAPGFYVIGDAVGAARGIIQAAMTGVMAARTIARQNSRLHVREDRYDAVCSDALRTVGVF